MTGSLNYAFRLPRSLSRLRKQVRTLAHAVTSTDGADLPGAARPGGDCIVISDVPRHELRGGLDTDLLQTV